jgi:predicted metal-binding protein
MIRELPSRWRSSILVCAKCEKKLGNEGFGKAGRKRLSKLLRKRLGGGLGRKAKAGVVTTRCLGVCPRGAVTVVDGRHPDRWMVVAAGTPVEEVEARLEPALPLTMPPEARAQA